MAGALITGDVSIGNLNEALDDSYKLRCVVDNCGASNKYSDLHDRVRFGQNVRAPELSQYIPGIRRDDPIISDIPAVRPVMAGELVQEPAVKDTRTKGDNEVIYLRDKVSSLFRENCSLKEQSAKLGIENRLLQKQATELKQENVRLREKLQQISQLKTSPQNQESQPYLVPIPHSGSYDSQKAIYDSSKLISYKNNSGTGQFNEKVLVNKGRTANDSFGFLTGISSQVTLTVTEQLHNRNSPQLNQVLDGAGLSNEDESYGEKEVLDMLDSIQLNSTQVKETITAHNKWLTEMVKKVSTTKTLKSALAEQVEQVKDYQNKVVSSLANSKPEVSECSGSSVDQLLQRYGTELVKWVGEQNGTICGEYGDSENQILVPVCEEESICPMCQAAFPKSVAAKDFEAHVMDHFKSDEFDIIPQDGDFG